MSADWKQYQEEAAAFFRSLGFQATVDYTVEGVRSKHAIDVYVTFERWGMSHIWIVECKHRPRAVTKADVETLKSIASEIGASLAFLLSESGFQSGAFDAARKTNQVLQGNQTSSLLNAFSNWQYTRFMRCFRNGFRPSGEPAAPLLGGGVTDFI